MRGILVLTLLAASLTYGAANDYVEARDLRLPATGIDKLKIDSGAGSLDVVGIAGSDEIAVRATINVPNSNDTKARKIIESDMTLNLAGEGTGATLTSHFENSLRFWASQPSIDLRVSVPERFVLVLDDGSGSLKVRQVLGDITIDDGSGSIALAKVGGDIRIDDGSGSISAENVGGSLNIVDGSGSITIATVGGSVTIDDGSGSISVSDVSKDLIIEDDGSGSLNFARIQGRVEKQD